ncbi:MAG: M28 family peptidase [Planctomycetes bacterium]|nr:M28 family peptidase [Planctomycetota bacterium]
MLRPLVLLWCALPLAAQAAPAAPATAGELGAPAAVPDGAPPHLSRIDRQDLQRHVAWLAADERQGRYTGSRGQQETAAYVADCFRKLGLKPLGDKKGFLQVYPLQRTYLDPATQLAFGDQKVTAKFAVFGARDDEKLALSGRFAWCGAGGAGQVPNNLQGKLPVVVLQGATKSQGVANDLQAHRRFAEIAAELRNRGADAGVVCLLDDGSALANALNYHALQPDHPRLHFGSGRGGAAAAPVPLFVLAREPSLRLFAHLGIALDDAGGPRTGIVDEKASGKLAITVRTDAKGSASNVVAVLEGRTKKAEAVLVSAHHDHLGRRIDGDVFNGADDNGSGTAGLLEIAEAFAAGGERPERSIVFLSVSGEELGLWGAAWFGEHPTWPIERLVANLNVDMIGRAGGAGDSIELLATPSHQHARYSTLVRDAVRLGQKFGISFASGDRYYERSDQAVFARRNVPVLFLCVGDHPDYHQVTDHADKLDYGKAEAIARLAFWAAWTAAQQKGRPQELGAQPGW